jgi:hypothetical protein
MPGMPMSRQPNGIIISPFSANPNPIDNKTASGKTLEAVIDYNDFVNILNRLLRGRRDSNMHSLHGGKDTSQYPGSLEEIHKGKWRPTRDCPRI